MTTIDLEEVRRFDTLAREWWSLDGPLAPLHRMNPVRLQFIKDTIVKEFSLDRKSRRPLDGLRVLDVGCGCGLLAEPLCRMGASVTALDPGQQNIEVARLHAEAAGLEVQYWPTDSGEYLAGNPGRFDVVTCLEVIEHSSAPDFLIDDLAELTGTGGLAFVSTLNRTSASFLKAIVAAEYLLGWLPKGTHDWRRFVSPSELSRWLRTAGFVVQDVRGIAYDQASDSFQLVNDRSTNYIVAARRT